MSELSPEAHVAAEAAASAVEELHEREAIADAAVEADIRAADAENRAANAEETATVAVLVAEESAQISTEIALEAATVAEEAHEQAATSADYGQRAIQEIEALRAEVAPIIQRHQDEEAARIAAMETASRVEEVDVTDGNATGNSTGTGDESPRVSVSGPDRPTGRLRRGRR
jgi:hypothetical protein